MYYLTHINSVVYFYNERGRCDSSSMNGVAKVKLQTPSDLARLVKNARVQRHLTQQDVADAAGITRQSLARLERGNGGTSFDTVLLILDHLGIQLDASTERRTPPATVASSAAQAAADALAKRITPPILGLAPQIDPSLLPKIDTSGILKQVEVNLDPATLASIRAASRRLTESLTIPGSVLINQPRAAGADSPATAEAQADVDPDAAGIE